MRKKKASLNMSVEAIIVIILAITILGLGLGFIRGMFGKVSTQFEEMVANEPEPPLASSSQPITLSRESIVAQPGEEVALKVGFYNTGASGSNYNCPVCDSTTLTDTQYADECCESVAGCTCDTNTDDDCIDPGEACTGTATVCADYTTVAAGLLDSDSADQPDRQDARETACVASCTFTNNQLENNNYYVGTTSNDICSMVGGGSTYSATPSILCSGVIDGTPQASTKTVQLHDRATLSLIFKISSGTPTGTKLCTVNVGNVEKDLMIRVK